ncbi:MAG: ABC-2 family transporter protein [Eubacteriales bacterium]|nr:ABC-2 family transporter protein [Eubacteriales bacterium]
MKKYIATMRMSLKESGYFGAMNVVGTYLMKWLRLLALLMIWKVLFAVGADTQGMTLEQMLTYTLLSAALSPLLDVRTPASSWLHEGTMLSLYQRPMSVFGQLAASTAGSWGMHLLLFTLPCLLLAPLLGARLAVNPWGVLSLALAVSQGFCVDFLFAGLIIRANNMSWMVESLRRALTALFTGALIPFAVLPFGIGKVLEWMPLGSLAGAPLAIATGLSTPQALLPVQLLWNALLWPVAVWWFRRCQERMVSYGG